MGEGHSTRWGSTGDKPTSGLYSDLFLPRAEHLALEVPVLQHFELAHVVRLGELVAAMLLPVHAHLVELDLVQPGATDLGGAKMSPTK